jgi:hypothetical protein
MQIQLVSFSSAESDTIVVRQFIKGTNFQTLKDTVLLDGTNSLYVDRGIDTLEVDGGDSTSIITSKYDYEIYIPSVKRLVKINDLTEDRRESYRGCYNLIKSYFMDGRLYNSPQLFIVK